MKKRKKIKLISFGISLFTILCIWGILSSIKAWNFEKQIKLSQEKALTQLCEYIDSIEVSLIKSMYASSGYSLGNLTNKLQRDCAGAKESLSSLSSGETQLYNTYKFLSQVGEYTNSLNNKASKGNNLSAEDREALKKLSVYASGLSLRFQHMASLLSSDYLTFDELPDNMLKVDNSSENLVSYLDSISDAELTFEDYPGLIYDGPFSDNILTKESVLLRDAEEVSRELAKKIAADCLNTQEKFLVEEEDTNGKTASYCFRTDSASVAVTKHGGYPLQVISNATAGEEKLTQADAIEKASVYLNKLNFKNMVSTYAASNDGICTINFAYKQNSFICYPDLIKVSVSLTDGKITGLESSDYLMNHVERNIPKFEKTPQDVMDNIAPSLTVKKISAAVIPTLSGKERSTYELFCEADDGQHILIYKDITTGEEADILILLYSDNGTLTK